MSFPAVGTKTLWRNDATEVKRFFDERHPGKYWVFNCSESIYDASRFDGRVSNYNWQDHHAPPFHLLVQMVDEMHRKLQEDPENVVIMHCNSGKGRAGLSCVCLLLYSGFFRNVVDCAKLFGARRFTDALEGVSQPC